MFERFTDGARRVLVLAQEEARMLNHDYIGTEHILLGVIREGERAAAGTLQSLGISAEAVRRQVEQVTGRGQQPCGHIPFTPQAKKALALSLSAALQLGHADIGLEHILLGLIGEGKTAVSAVPASASAEQIISQLARSKGEGTAALMLVKAGADLNQVQRQATQLARSYHELRSAGPPPGQQARTRLAEPLPADRTAAEQDHLSMATNNRRPRPFRAGRERTP
jgi:ATP-dependent Clp protease ATP-binding subunit ClpC